MKNLSAFINSKGMKFGIYGTASQRLSTCAPPPTPPPPDRITHAHTHTPRTHASFRFGRHPHLHPRPDKDSHTPIHRHTHTDTHTQFSRCAVRGRCEVSTLNGIWRQHIDGNGCNA